jgi:hypothetical protein
MTPNNGKRDRAANDPHHRPAPVDLAEESVAGEEDPGASLGPGESSTTLPNAGSGDALGSGRTADGKAGERRRREQLGDKG